MSDKKEQPKTTLKNNDKNDRIRSDNAPDPKYKIPAPPPPPKKQPKE